MICRMQFTRTLAAFALSAMIPDAWAAAKVTKVEFVGTQDPNQILIRGDGPLAFSQSENPQDKQIIIELKDAKLADPSVAQKLDTSSFNSQVTQVSPYQVEGKDAVRVVIQLRDRVAASAKAEGNLIRVSLPSAGADKIASASSAPVTEGESGGTDATGVPKQQAPDRLDEFFEARQTRRFNGRPITLQVRDADLSDVFRLIGEASGFNIILSDEVRGKITLSLVDVPWDLALDTILHTQRLGGERNNNVLRIATLQSLTLEKQEQLQAKRAAEANAPRVTRLFPISYAKLDELQGILTKFAASEGSASASTSIQVDNRTNSIIVRDTADNIEKMRKLIELLDTQTPQVVIEAKIIEATEGFSKSIGGSLGVGRIGDLANASRNQVIASFSGGNPVDGLVGDPGVFSTGSAIVDSTSKSGALGVSLGLLPGVQRLNALLNLGESENQVKVISSPKTVVLNKEEANLTQGTPVLVRTTSTTVNGPISTEQVQSAMLGLRVKPTVANDGSVLLNIDVSRDTPYNLGGNNSAVATRNMKTMVVVESGSTLVIGGIYTMSTSFTASGFPILRKLPIIGALFGSESENTDRSELFIFITPRILNEKEAGLSS